MNARALITISLLLNAGLLAAVAWLATRPAPTPASPEVVTRVVKEAVSGGAMAPSSEGTPQAPYERFDWRQVESPDYKEYIARLRGIGCPEQTIRDIIIADVSKLYGEKRAALFNAPKVVRYWQSSETQYTRENVKYQQAARALEKEQSELIRELLGVDLRRELAKIYGGEPNIDRSLMFLSPERREPVQAMFDRFRELERDIYASANGEELNEEQRARLDALKKEREAALAGMLSAEELKEYEMSNSRLARDIRGNLNGFDATEQEFLAIYAARQAFNEQFGERGRNEDDAKKAARKQAEQELEQQLATALGPERFAAYQRGQDGDYEDLYRVAKRYDLAQETAVAVYDMKRLAESARRTIEQNPNLPPAQRAALLKELSTTTKQAAEATLGADAFKYYKSRDGRWMDRIGIAPPTKKGS